MKREQRADIKQSCGLGQEVCDPQTPALALSSPLGCVGTIKSNCLPWTGSSFVRRGLAFWPWCSDTQYNPKWLTQKCHDNTTGWCVENGEKVRLLPTEKTPHSAVCRFIAQPHNYIASEWRVWHYLENNLDCSGWDNRMRVCGQNKSSWHVFSRYTF